MRSLETLDATGFAVPPAPVPADRVPTCGDDPGSVPLTDCCRACGLVLERERVARDAYVCRCGEHFPMHADAWIRLLADAGTWREHWRDLEPVDVLGWTRPKPYRTVLDGARARGLNEAVRAGHCAIGGRPLWLAVFDFRFMGGSLSVVSGERLTRAMERAADERLPFLLVTASGGARMQESAFALMQMAKVNAAVAALHDARVPYLSVLTYPTYGGTAASLALLADINIAEPGALVGFTGPRVIEQSTHERLPADFQTAEYQLQHGQVDMIVSRTDLRRTLARLHDLLW